VQRIGPRLEPTEAFPFVPGQRVRSCCDGWGGIRCSCRSERPSPRYNGHNGRRGRRLTAVGRQTQGSSTSWWRYACPVPIRRFRSPLAHPRARRPPSPGPCPSFLTSKWTLAVPLWRYGKAGRPAAARSCPAFRPDRGYPSGLSHPFFGDSSGKFGWRSVSDRPCFVRIFTYDNRR
jgi:hypothetical protein